MRIRSLVAAVAASLALCATPAAAQPAGSLDRFRAAPTPEDDLHLARATDLGHLRFGAQLVLDYGLDPLVYERVAGDAGSEAFSVVGHQLVGTVGLSLGLFDRVVVFAGLPASLVMSGDTDPALMATGVQAADGPGLGDAFLGARVRLLGAAEDRFALALQARATLPSSGVPDEVAYRGDRGVTFSPDLLAELRLGSGVRLVANVGARIREASAANLANLGFGSELTYGLGATFLAWKDETDPRTHLDVLVQAYGDSAFDRVGDREGTALEATAGARFAHASGFVATLAAGPGLNRGFGSPDLRGVLQLGWATPTAAPVRDTDGDGIFDDTDRCVNEPEDVDTFEDADGCPDPDDDRDGILDTADACRLEPETVNRHEDTDGCPDTVPDTDGDGLTDDVDACPAEAEDRDGFEDENGCPDPDNDGDGVLDTADRCVSEPGVVAEQGCPVRDRDSDTVADPADNCPDEPGRVEFQGCREAQRVTITEGSLRIIEEVFFKTNAADILPRSFPLLENVAAVLRAHPEITRVLVEGHTDARGRRERNITLSQRRAESVVRFLVDRGRVEASRLEAHGYGPDRPRVQNASTAAEHAQNRRVEFNIPGGAEGVQQQQREAGNDSTDR